MKKKLISILIMLLIVVPMAAYAYGEGLFEVKSSSAHHVGDLEVDWGVRDGRPIFVVENIFPGDTQERRVKINNESSTPRPVGVRGVKTSETSDFSLALQIVIYEGTNIYYGDGSSTGPKTLAQFFEESIGPNGIKLFDLGAGSRKDVKFKVTFDPSAGNEFQNGSVVFDIVIGIAVEVPVQCADIQFDGQPIFGTQKNNDLKGTNGNDLIFGFEGNDEIDGKAGHDCIVAGKGNDKISGKSGRDVIFGDDGNDKIEGDDDADKLFGGLGNDELNGGSGDDDMEGNDGNDKFSGGNGDDTMIGGAGNDKFEGGTGRDRAEGNGGNDEMKGDGGNDTLLGDGGNDKANGGSGTDTCVAESRSACEL